MNNKEQTKQAHDAIANKYYELYKDDKSDLMYFDEFLSQCKNKILDLGCGMGHYSTYMYNKGFNVTGIDFSKEMLKIAKKNNNHIEFIEADICDLSKLENNKYDGIVMAYVLQHLSKEEVKRLFDEINNHLQPESKLLLFLREGNSVLEELEPINPKFKYVINEYTMEEIGPLLNTKGWEIMKAERKKYIEDPNSLSPNTLVILAKHRDNF